MLYTNVKQFHVLANYHEITETYAAKRYNKYEINLDRVINYH